MRTIRALLLTLGLVLATRSAEASDPAVRTKIETFFNKVIDGDAGKAFDGLLEGSIITGGQTDSVTKLRYQLETGMRTYGRAVGFELLEEKSFGSSLVRCVYIMRLEKHPLFWEFFFYRGTDVWLPINVRFNGLLAPFKFDSATAVAAPDPAQP